MELAELKAQRDNLAVALQAEQGAAHKLAVARAAYDKALAVVLEQMPPETVQALEDAQAAHEIAKAYMKATRENTKKQLAEYQREEPESKKPLDGFSRRDSIVAEWDNEGALVAQLARYAPHLLKPDEKAIAQYVKTFAEPTGFGGLSLARFGGMIPALRATYAYTWAISDTTVLKHVPNEEGDLG